MNQISSYISWFPAISSKEKASNVKTFTTCAAITPVFQHVSLLQRRQKVHFSLSVQHLVVSLQPPAEEGVHGQSSALVVAQVQLGSVRNGVTAGGRRDAEVLEPSPHLPQGFGPPVQQRRHATGLHGWCSSCLTVVWFAGGKMISTDSWSHHEQAPCSSSMPGWLTCVNERNTSWRTG